MIKRLSAVVLSIILFMNIMPTETKAAAVPYIGSASAVLIDASTGQVLFEKNMREVRAPASITKIVTIYLSVLYGGAEDRYTVSDRAIDLIPEATTAGLIPGEVVTHRDMQYASMLWSANDACNVIAEGISGSIEGFASLMNEFAASAGAYDTFFTNPHGLPDSFHQTTAYDMAIMTRIAIQNSEFNSIFSSIEYDMAATNLSDERDINSIDYMINPEREQYYEAAWGGKTGWTVAAQHTKVTVAKSGNRELIAVVMGASSASVSYNDTEQLLDYGFENFREVSFLASDVEPIAIDVYDGRYRVGIVNATLSSGGRYLLNTDFSSDDVLYTTNIPSKLDVSQTNYGDFRFIAMIPSANGSFPSEISIPLKSEYTELNLNFTTQAGLTAQRTLEFLSNPIVLVTILLLAFTIILLILMKLFYKKRPKRNRRRHIKRMRKIS